MYPRRRPMPPGGNRFIGGGFLGPFVLGGLVGGWAAPAFYPRPMLYPVPVPPPYPPYPFY